MSVIRVSRGSFPSEKFEQIKAKLQASALSLVRAVETLKGCQQYFAGIEIESNTLVNISVWETLDNARQMDTLAPMLMLAAQFTAMGVIFERPIINFNVVWNINNSL